MKLNTRAFTLTSGIYTGIVVFLFVCGLSVSGRMIRRPPGIRFVSRHARITPLRSLAGLVGGFVYGCTMGALFSSLYNRLAAAFEPAESEEEPSHHHHRHHHDHEHIPWLFALAHRPGIHT